MLNEQQILMVTEDNTGTPGGDSLYYHGGNVCTAINGGEK